MYNIIKILNFSKTMFFLHIIHLRVYVLKYNKLKYIEINFKFSSKEKIHCKIKAVLFLSHI